MHRLARIALLLPVLMAAPAPGQVASPPQILGPLVGPGSATAQPGLAFFGTDLGWTVEHKGELRILFGDTDDVYNAVCFPQLHNDDSQGTMPLARPDTGVPLVTMLADPTDPNVLQRLIVTRRRRVAGDGLRPGARLGVQRRRESRRHHGPRRHDPVQGGGALARRGVPRIARRSSRSRELALRRRSPLLEDGGRVRSRTERHPDRVRARDRRRLQHAARRDLPAHRDRTVRRSVQLAERRHARLRALHRGERDGVRHRGPRPPRSLRVASRRCAPTSSSTRRRGRFGGSGSNPERRTTTSRATARSSSGAGRTSRPSRVARPRSTCWRIRCPFGRWRRVDAGASAPCSTRASTSARAPRAGRGSRRRPGRSRSTARSAAVLSKSSRWSTSSRSAGSAERSASG